MAASICILRVPLRSLHRSRTGKVISQRDAIVEVRHPSATFAVNLVVTVRLGVRV